ncbi:pyrimidine-nucleoside phosphorylase [Fodinisporobacter ferrooxydans]|uniref:Pyrimidine-nucleoside phosphorylase n=1 Tax=Fodinisporobacter ferrooxydans TaxID=2901836 RepID=A0ABY4CH99_9BACL|nr:pyrimidine-nucleoside phosphorylase [Alicyclobacillaceae bacterium MYW30-H2]
MRMVDLIHKKRQGHSFTTDELRYIIQGYTCGDIPDYQMAAWLMAVYFQGMTDEEIADLTTVMVESGDTIDLSGIRGIKVDKHSTGGVGDKISLIVAPLVATVGVPVAKMSGRGLGHTGGTIDKLEAIEGFQAELSNEQFIEHVNTYKMAIAGQTGNLAPADKKLYALRDVTATVDSMPLIASSIMSKKIASGADCIVLDVKMGAGAFMKSLADARRLANTMVKIGQRLNRKTIAIISDMNQPLGCEVGNANEVKEAIEVLRGNGPEDLQVISLTIAAHMTVLGGIYKTFADALHNLTTILQSGSAFHTFRQFIQAQGGNPDLADNPERLPQAANHIDITAWKTGYIQQIDAEAVGTAAMMAGAGRQKKGDAIDPAAGITLLKKSGDPVAKGERMAVIHTNKKTAEEALQRLQDAYVITEQPPQIQPYIHEIVC